MMHHRLNPLEKPIVRDIPNEENSRWNFDTFAELSPADGNESSNARGGDGGEEELGHGRGVGDGDGAEPGEVDEREGEASGKQDEGKGEKVG